MHRGEKDSPKKAMFMISRQTSVPLIERQAKEEVTAILRSPMTLMKDSSCQKIKFCVGGLDVLRVTFFRT